MGASLWDQVWRPLLIGLAIQIVAAALCFLRVRLWNCMMKRIKPQTAVEESAYDQRPSDSDAVANANAVPDLEMGNGYGSVEGGESMTEREIEMIIVNGGEGIEQFSDQHPHTPEIESPVIAPKTQVTGVAARGGLVEMDVPVERI